MPDCLHHDVVELWGGRQVCAACGAFLWSADAIEYTEFEKALGDEPLFGPKDDDAD